MTNTDGLIGSIQTDSQEQETQRGLGQVPNEQPQQTVVETKGNFEDEMGFVDQKVDEEEVTVVVAASREGPVVDPTGTFSNWTGLDASNTIDPDEGLKDEDHLPPPMRDEKNFKILNPNPNVQLRRAVFSSRPANKGLAPMYLYAGNDAELIADVEQYNILEQRKKDSYNDPHSEALAETIGTQTPDQYMWRVQFRPGSLWTNVPKFDGKETGLAPSRDDGLVGTVQTSVGGFRFGVGVMIPLYHTGIHVRIRTPTGRQLAALDAIVAQEKNVFGRRTGGAMFANHRAYLESAILELFVDCIYSCTLTNWTQASLRNLIDHRDIQLMALALSSAKYPTDYPTKEPCTEISAGCKELKETSFSPINSLVVDEARFSPTEVRYLAERFVNRTELEVLNFQKEASWNTMKVVELTPKISLRLKHPRLLDIINSGITWSEEIIAEVKAVLGDESMTRNRQQFTYDLIERISLRRFISFVDAIIVDGREVPISDDKSELIALFDSIGDDTQVVRRFEIDIRNFIESNIVAYMAIPRYLCPKCEKRMEVNEPERLQAYNANPILTPQDAVSRFFTLRSL